MNKNVFFHGDVEIGEGSSIQDNVILGSEEGMKVNIGENALIRSGTVIYSGVTIGKNFMCGHNVLIREDTVISDDVLVGTNSVIDGNCRIGNKVRIQTNVYVFQTSYSGFLIVYFIWGNSPPLKRGSQNGRETDQVVMIRLGKYFWYYLVKKCKKKIPVKVNT